MYLLNKIWTIILFIGGYIFLPVQSRSGDSLPATNINFWEQHDILRKNFFLLKRVTMSKNCYANLTLQLRMIYVCGIKPGLKNRIWEHVLKIKKCWLNCCFYIVPYVPGPLTHRSICMTILFLSIAGSPVIIFSAKLLSNLPQL